MIITQKQKRLMTIGGVLLVLALLIIAVITALRLQQIGTEPVAPSVPKSKPQAQAAIPTPGAASACRKTFQIAQGPTLTPTVTPTGGPSPTATPTGTGGGLVCINISVAGGTTRKTGEQINFTCSGTPSSDVTQCKFRFGDGSAEVLDDDCNVLHSYSTTGTYPVSCEVKDRGGSWKSSGACGGQIEIKAVTGSGTPTLTPTKATTGGVTSSPTKIPTVPIESLPQAGGLGPTIGAITAGLGAVILGILLIL
ncbi:PKD domain-containing protein [Candidatus Collierbacteria bacterium]|nr:PKD domain-containing protein [Candidatus Collierbacteria bacterium]